MARSADAFSKIITNICYINSRNFSPRPPKVRTPSVIQLSENKHAFWPHQFTDHFKTFYGDIMHNMYANICMSPKVRSFLWPLHSTTQALKQFNGLCIVDESIDIEHDLFGSGHVLDLGSYFNLALTRVGPGGCFRRYFRNGGVQRGRLWHTLSYVTFA